MWDYKFMQLAWATRRQMWPMQMWFRSVFFHTINIILAALFNIYNPNNKKHCTCINKINYNTSHMYAHIMKYWLIQNDHNTLWTLLLQNLTGQVLSPSSVLSLEFKCSIYIIHSRLHRPRAAYRTPSPGGILYTMSF